jgi:hypothetical protein
MRHSGYALWLPALPNSQIEQRSIPITFSVHDVRGRRDFYRSFSHGGLSWIPITVYTAFLQHFFPRKIELVMPKFADWFEDVAVLDGFFDESEFFDSCRFADQISGLFRSACLIPVSHVKVSAFIFISHITFFALFIKSWPNRAIL